RGRIALAALAACALSACSSGSSVVRPSPSPSVSLSPSASPLPCVQPAALPRVSGVTSAYPIVLLASGLNVPDDLLYVTDDGSVLVGEHGNGHLDRITAPGKVTRLSQTVPEAEGIAIVDGVIY